MHYTRYSFNWAYITNAVCLQHLPFTPGSPVAPAAPFCPGSPGGPATPFSPLLWLIPGGPGWPFVPGCPVAPADPCCPVAPGNPCCPVGPLGPENQIYNNKYVRQEVTDNISTLQISDLGAPLDSEFAMKAWVINMTISCYFYLRHVWPISQSLTQEAACSLIHSHVM